MQKETKILIALIIGIAMSFWIMAVARAEEPGKTPGLKFAWVEESEIKDVQMLLRTFGKSEGRSFAGTGVCSSPLWDLHYGKRWIANFVSACGMVAISIEDEADSRLSGGIEPLNLLGLRVYGGYTTNADFAKGQWTIGGGLSFTGLTDQLLK